MTSTHRPTTSRRGFLLGTGLAVLGAGGGIAVGALVDRSPDEVEVPNPQVLLAAAQSERELIAGIDETLATAPKHPSAELLRVVRANHQAHLVALHAAVAVVVGTTSSGVSTPPPRSGRELSPEQFRILEAAAARAAAARALTLTGRDAALLASISACEATHAELLS
jgi:hypothetical protein